MTKIDFEEIVKVITGLWPNVAMTAEQQNVFWMVAHNHDVSDVKAALRGWCSVSKHIIKPAELREQLGKRAGAGKAVDPWSAQKFIWIKASPDRRQEIESWSDDECERNYLRSIFERAAKARQPEEGQGAARRHWIDWQQCLQRHSILGACPDEWESRGYPEACDIWAREEERVTSHG